MIQSNSEFTFSYFPSLGLRGSVVITNKHSVPAEFQWHAREEVDTNSFYMMHPSGMCHLNSTCRSMSIPFRGSNAQVIYGEESPVYT